MDFLVRFVQLHESFRRPELEALVELYNVPCQIKHYDESSPFCIIQLPNPEVAKKVISRAILCKGIYELWGSGANYGEVHACVQRDTSEHWPKYRHTSFKFCFDSFQGSKSTAEQRNIVNSFSYLDFKGAIVMKGAAEKFTIFEEYEHKARFPHAIFFGRLVGHGARSAITTYSLKKRHYLSTTSMDSELALIGANLALAATGKLVYDPFIGTGGLPLACAHFGAMAWGSDIDPRAVRGKDGLSVSTSFQQYNLASRSLGSFIGDLTHSPLRVSAHGLLDVIICDPPYGVREGLKVLGSRDDSDKEVWWIDGKPAHLKDDYIPPKKPYSFDAMLVDIMDFAACMLIENGRLSFWMPTANDEDQELGVPTHPALELVSNCVQPFNKWSRRLLTYRMMPGASREESHVAALQVQGTADDLNKFRKRVGQMLSAVTDADIRSTSKDSSEPQGQKFQLTLIEGPTLEQ